MYLRKLLVRNSGIASDLEIEPTFNDDDSPQPLLLVGTNGCGKTNALSIIADALTELAANSFSDVTPSTTGLSRKYFRSLGPATTRIGAQFELCISQFTDQRRSYFCVSKSGTVGSELARTRFTEFPTNFRWDESEPFKRTTGPKDGITRIFRRGCYAFFPSSRAEEPYWSTEDRTKEQAHFEILLADELNKPIVLNRTFHDLKPWLIDVFLDQSIDAFSLRSSMSNLDKIVTNVTANSTALANINTILRIILNEPSARLVRTGRVMRDRKLQIVRDKELIMPSLEALSSGQATLLSMFFAILRYADTGVTASPTQNMTGIVLVDEVDAHLHSDFQLRTLPHLMQLFPRIQFILSCHSPFVPLGLEDAYGENNVQIVELPSGRRIEAERFKEFMSCADAVSRTKLFDESISEKVKQLNRPLVLFEGQTDPKYFSAAAQLLGYERIVGGVDFDWVGTETDKGATDGGKDRLKHAKTLLRNNPSLCKSTVVLLFDCDANVMNSDEGMLCIRGLERNEANKTCNDGVENLLPERVFEEKFFSSSEKRMGGANTAIVRKLNKVKLCTYLCETERNVDVFEGFRSSLNMLEEAIFGK